MKLGDFLVDPKSLEAFTPPRHGETVNHRLWPMQDGPSGIEIIHGFLGHGGGAEPHFHRVSDQMIYMLSGQMRLVGLEDSVTLTPGQFLFIPKGTEHRVDILSAEGVNILVMYMPRLDVEDIRPAEALSRLHACMDAPAPPTDTVNDRTETDPSSIG